MKEHHADELIAAGEMTPDWREAFLAVPRAAFIPDVIWDLGADNMYHPVHRADDSDRWAGQAYGTEPVITQVDDGAPVGPRGTGDQATSSASMPLMTARMLRHLDVHSGERVLEIGTGTGWNAALLAYRLGAEQVVTVEIDPDVIAHARKALSGAGYGAVTTVVGNGTFGYPPGAPYDGVIATAECDQVPYAWVAQTRPGGRIVTPWSNPYFQGGLLVLTVDDGGTARGHLTDRAGFMRLRDQRPPQRSSVLELVNDTEDHADRTLTRLHPYYFVVDYGAQLTISLRVPDCEFTYVPYNPRFNEGAVWLYDATSGSWAGHFHHSPAIDDDEFPVLQYGRRRLWDEVEAAHTWWTEHGKPGVNRWQFVVTPEGQRIDLR